jgi:hypothetical protein
MKYEFKQHPHGTIRLEEGYTVLIIVEGRAMVDTPEQKALAEKYGGRPVVKVKTSSKKVSKRGGER